MAYNNNFNLQNPHALAIDGAGNAWEVSDNNGGTGVFELSTTGVILSPANGYRYFEGAPYVLAIDGSGNLWGATQQGTVFQVLGAATPVITPLAAGLPLIPTTDGSSKLGTRP